MRIFIFPFIIVYLSLAGVSCTKELKYTKEDLLALAQKADPNVKVILPRSMAEGVSCTDYTVGCLSAHTVMVKGLELIAVEFDSKENAVFGAKKIRGYYVRNWVLDDVTGEVVLEEFATKYLKAKKPLEDSLKE